MLKNKLMIFHGVVALFFFLFYCSSLTVLANDSEDLLKKADSLYSQRMNVDNARKAIKLYEKVLKIDPINEEAAWKIAKTTYWVAMNTPNKEPKIKLLEKGISKAKEAIKINPKSTGGHYWLGVSYGIYGKTKGVTKSLSLIKPIKKEMAIVIKQDPKFEGGGAFRVLGRLYSKIPGLFGGSKSKAIKSLEQAIKYGPDRWLNHIYLAEIYIDEGNKEKAKKLLQQVLDGPATKDMEPEYALWLNDAKKLMNKIKNN